MNDSSVGWVSITLKEVHRRDGFEQSGRGWKGETRWSWMAGDDEECSTFGQVLNALDRDVQTICTIFAIEL